MPSANRAAPVRLTPNLFGVSFGISGLAECWAAASDSRLVPVWPGNTLWIIAAVIWAGTLVAYLRNVVIGGRLRTELGDPTFGPFVALIAIVLMLLGVALAGYARTAGLTVFVIAFVLTLLVGGWLSAEWILADMTLPQWHPGYFLPTAAGGFIAATGWAALGYRQLALLMFGYGAVCWLVLGSILLLRLFTQPALPVALLPTMAIELAPPVVGGAAWFEINGGRVDGVALALAGYGVLMALVQIRLIQAYRTVPFSAGWWSYSFSYAAAFFIGIRWLAAEDAPMQRAWTYVLLAVITAGIAVLAAWSVRAMARHTFVPRPAAPTAT
jgi:tellurite resistance protein